MRRGAPDGGVPGVILRAARGAGLQVGSIVMALSPSRHLARRARRRRRRPSARAVRPEGRRRPPGMRCPIVHRFQFRIRIPPARSSPPFRGTVRFRSCTSASARIGEFRGACVVSPVPVAHAAPLSGRRIAGPGPVPAPCGRSCSSDACSGRAGACGRASPCAIPSWTVGSARGKRAVGRVIKMMYGDRQLTPGVQHLHGLLSRSALW